MERRLYRLTVLLLAVLPSAGARAQTLLFDSSAAGVSKSITQWGVDTAWPSPDNMRHGIQHMGVDEIDVVRVNFYIDEPLQPDGTLGPTTKARLDVQLALADMAGSKPIALTPNSGDATDPWYLNGNEVRIDRWVEVIQATRLYVAQQGKTVIEVEPFNEPDFWPGQGTPQNLKSVMDALRADSAFQNVAMVGASTLNSDNASGWYNVIAGPTDYGATHQLAGSTDSYINFIQQVKAAGDTPYNPEIHSFGEVLYGAEYGLEGGIWWGPAFVSRGLLVKSVQGQRLGYAENRGAGTAAAVYRAPDGAIRAFAGGFERDYQGTPNMYRVVSTDRDAYFNGVGPIRDYMIHAGQNDQGSYVDIQYDGDILPALDGARWRLVNRLTGQVLEVQGGGLADGANIRVADDAGASHQRWDIVREIGGHYRLSAAHSGRTAEIADWSLDNGANARQWGTGDSVLQQWFIEHAEGGYYYLRNGHSNKFLTTSAGGNVLQSDPTRNRTSQQWEFVLANPAASERFVSHYEFEANGLDSVGGANASLIGGPGYAPGRVGQALNFDGSDDYAILPAGVVNTDNLTIAAWVRWDGGADWQRVFDFGDDTTSNLFLTPRSGAGTMRFAITTDGNTAEQYLDTDPLPVGEWVHVAVTLGGNTGVLYVNGEAQVAGQILIDPSDIDPANNYLGKSQYPDALFDGRIDDFRVYDYALDATQIDHLIFDSDFNGDGVVDAADYTVWRDNLGATGQAAYSSGDADGDGSVTTADYDIWVRQFGQTFEVTAPSFAEATPEPAALAMALLAALAMTRGRRVSAV